MVDQQELNKALNVLAHDASGRIANIGSYLYLLKRTKPLTKEQLEYIQNARDRIKEAHEIIDNFWKEWYKK